MRFLSEFRDPDRAKVLINSIKATASRQWTIMEVCGGQTHTVLQYGIDQILADEVRLIHGPGCPVCVTPLEYIDRAIAIASRPEVTFCTYGDMLRIPGSSRTLFVARSEGADVRAVYSAVEALNLALELTERLIVFFGIGFETTAPATALAISKASKIGLKNFCVLCCHVLVPPAMIALLESPHNMIQAYLAAGHVCTVQGTAEYEAIAARYKLPIVVTGFEPFDILNGIAAAVEQLENGEYRVENRYARTVKPEGNRNARDMVNDVFEVCDRRWRGLGLIRSSGFRIRDRYQAFNAERRIDSTMIDMQEPVECISGLILQGLKKPVECPFFRTICTPSRPCGASMVSSEGACAAYYSTGRQLNEPNQ